MVVKGYEDNEVNAKHQNTCPKSKQTVYEKRTTTTIKELHSSTSSISYLIYTAHTTLEEMKRRRKKERKKIMKTK